jgi:hypothetical protein
VPLPYLHTSTASRTRPSLRSQQHQRRGQLLRSRGNRTQKVSTLPGYPGVSSNYNANDQLSTDGYDANGNTVGSGTNTGVNGYGYDFENH